MTPKRIVNAYLERSRTPGLGRIVDITDPAPAPGGERIAFTGTVYDTLDTPPHTRIYVVEVATSRITEVGGTARPTWSGDGSLLAYVDGPNTVTVLTLATNVHRYYTLPGMVEDLRFDRRADRILARIAEPGADRSGVQGSGQLTDPDHTPTGPQVDGSRGSAGWRRAWAIDIATDAVTRLSPPGWSVWDADWCAHGIVAIASEFPEEGDWYHARLVRFAGPDDAATVLTASSSQLGCLSTSPNGQTIAYVEALCSDRGLIAGDIKTLDLSTHEASATNTNGVDVTSLTWRDDEILLAAGQRHLDTVIGHITQEGCLRELWSSSTRSCGGWYPRAVPIASQENGAFTAALHGYGQPPALTIVTPSGEHVLVDTSHPGTDYVRDVGGALASTSWRAPDGLTIEGLLAAPDRPGPHPLVVLLHGGPVAAYRPSWSLIYGWTPLLVAAGYAVLHPNPRGSGGRGQDFAALVRGDMGGADTHDVISAVDILSDRGLIDPTRVAVAGRSYGGYLAAWLVTQTNRFAAAMPMAPVTNWYSQHFTSNLGDFAATFLADTPTNPGGRFFSRSPVFVAEKAHTPVMTIAGAHDRCTPPSQGLEFHRALIEHERDSTLVLYPSEGHHIDTSIAERDLFERMLGFLNTHLPSQPSSITGTGH